MIKYFKNIEGNYIVSIGTGCGSYEITKEEYENLMLIIRGRPVPEEGYENRLKVDLTWDRIELPPEPADPDITSDEALSIIVGGDF